tara:strand:+ start:292 stop:483 length:192 start_codon:yes stop_codon:yes gene_type:complete
MKYKLKEGVKASDIPRYSGLAKNIASQLAGKATVVVDNLPKNLLNYVEEVAAPAPKKDNKGGK